MIGFPLKKNFFLAVLGLHCYAQPFSGCVVCVSHCDAFSCCGAQWAAAVVASGLSIVAQ